jgi:hypothetical protein
LTTNVSDLVDFNFLSILSGLLPDAYRFLQSGNRECDLFAAVEWYVTFVFPDDDKDHILIRSIANAIEYLEKHFPNIVHVMIPPTELLLYIYELE